MYFPPPILKEYFQVCHYLELRKLMGFPGSSAGKESAYNAGDSGSILGLEGSLGERDRLPIPIFLGFPGSSDRKLRNFMFSWKSNSLLNFLISCQCFSDDTLNFFGNSLEFILIPSYVIVSLLLARLLKLFKGRLWACFFWL